MHATNAPLAQARPGPGEGACAHGAVLTVDLAAVAANTGRFASRTRAELMAVVKADGFGHGSADAARTALANGATWLGVTSIAEGLALRQAGLAAPVLSWLNPVDAGFGLAHDGPVLNEVNTMPGFTEHSQVPRMFAAAGLRYPELLDMLVSDALTGPAMAPVRSGDMHNGGR